MIQLIINSRRIQLENLNHIIANNLTELRKTAKMTQADVASRLNYSDKAVSKWERGESMPDIHILKTLADMYRVSVDYLLEENHGEASIPEKAKRIIHNNRMIITLLAVSLVWLVATVMYVILGLAMGTLTKLWLAYVAAVPVSLVVLLVFNSIWFNRKFNFAIITGLVWSVLLFTFLLFEIERMWLIFLIGIPAQLIIVFWSRLKSAKNLK